MTQNPQYNSLQALRALAAFMVVLYHLGGPGGFESKIGGGPVLTSWAYPIGALGVDLFFVISGFIMTVTTARLARGPGSARSFLLRRVARVYPAYFVITALIFLVHLWRPELINSSEETPPDVLASFLLLPQEGLPLLLVGWTLVYEMYFYLVFAACLLLSRPLLVAALGGWGALTVLLHQFVTTDSGPYLQLVGNLQNLEFLLGAGVALMVMGHRAVPSWVSLPTGAALFAVTCVLTLRTGHLDDDWLRLVGFGGGLALVLHGVLRAEVSRRWNTPAPLVALGDVSYSLYLVHVPILKVVAILAVALLPSGSALHLVSLLAALVLTVTGAWTYHLVVERPLLRLFRRRPTSQRASAPPLPRRQGADV